MEINRARAAYNSQKSGAQSRGIEFLLTFVEWCTWWGEDIDKRGSGTGNLQMQRYADTGPYALGNIRKGTPRQNSATCGYMTRNRNSKRNAEELQIALDALMNEPSKPAYDESECYSKDGTINKYYEVKTHRQQFSRHWPG